MDSPQKRTILRLTPIPESAPQKSLIIKLRFSSSKNFVGDPPKRPSSNDLDPDYLPGKSSRKTITRVTKQRPISLQDLARRSSTPSKVTISSPNSTLPPEPSSSPDSSSSLTLPAEHEDPSYTILNDSRIDAARDIVTIFYIWGRDEVRMELDEALALQSATADEAKLLQKVSWVRECLRGRYKVWIQVFDNYAIKEHRIRRSSVNIQKDPGVECEYPGCGRAWESGEFRVSFEPPGWTKSKNKVDKSTGYEEEDRKVNKPDEDNEPIIQLPDYQKLMTPKNIHKHGRGEFYCISCFEKLLGTPELAPSPPLSQKKRKRSLTVAEKYPRPSPLCRIYSSVFAETRVHAEGMFLLNDETADLVWRWKDGLFEEGIKRIMERFGDILGKDEGLSVKVEEEDGEVNVGEGRGLAELLLREKEKKEDKVTPGRKKKKY